MDEQDDLDDLDAELALFETQIRRVRAATAAPPRAPPAQPPPVTASSGPHAPRAASSANRDGLRAEALETHPTRAPAASTPRTRPTTAKPAPMAKPTTSATPTTSKPVSNMNLSPTRKPASTITANPSAPPGRWVWDGTTWRWRTATTPAAPAPTTQPTPALPDPAPQQPASKTSTKRTAAGLVWEDATLQSFPSNDHRIFVGDLAPDATEANLIDAFSVYPSFAMARIVRDKRSGQCRGYGFVSFLDGRDMVRALRELNGKYVGGRPVKLKRSTWQKRSLEKGKWKELRELRGIAKR